jgi:hypothetical protein
MYINSGDNKINWILRQDDTKTYPVYIYGKFREITPSELAKIINDDKIEITRYEYNSIISRLDAIEKYLNER